MGSYSDGVCREWTASDSFLAELAASGVSDYPDVWIDGGHVVDELSGVGVGGCGVYSLRSGAGLFGRRWEHLELLPPDGILAWSAVSCLIRFAVLFNLSAC